MKSILLLLLIAVSLFSCAQPGKPSFNKPDVLSSKFVRLVPDTNRMMLIENVVIDYGDLQAEADSVFYDKSNQQITLYGIKKGSFKGNVLSAGNTKAIIRYKKGETKLEITQ